MGVATLVLGIISFLSSMAAIGWAWMGTLAVLTGALGVILGFSGHKTASYRRLRTAGKILSIFGGLIGLALFIAMFV